MKKKYRFSAKVRLQDYIRKEKPIDRLEFNTIDNTIRISHDLVEQPEQPYQDVTIEIVVKDDNLKEALYRAENILEEKLGILTFYTMCPPIRLYKDIIHEELNENGDDVEALQPPNALESETVYHQKLILNNIDLLFTHPDEKITNSLRWFRKGLLDQNKTDSFISLWIALEMIASKLKPAGKKILKCPRCGQGIEICPHCDSSTETKAMEKDGIIHHITKNLKIEDANYYKDLNNMRNAIFHGRGTKERKEKITTEISKLKNCLLTAYYLLIYGNLPEPNDSVYTRFMVSNIELVTLMMTAKGKSLKEERDKINYIQLKNKI